MSSRIVWLNEREAAENAFEVLKNKTEAVGLLAPQKAFTLDKIF
jgi:hypothetical protein